MEVGESAFLKDIWSVIVKHTNIYDTIFLRASSEWLNKLCKECRPFPKYYVLDQDMCMMYLIKIGSTSCLDYVKNALHFEWDLLHSTTAVQFGQVSVLKHLRANGCPFNQQTALVECTRGSCSLDMIKYLHESGISWQSQNPATYNFISDMAAHGHLDCIKYAIQTGCTDRKVHNTPSMECLEYFVQNEFDWRSENLGTNPGWISRMCMCEKAATHGHLSILQYAHRHGAPLNASAVRAASAGKLDCLKYALENYQVGDYIPRSMKTIECFNYVLQTFGRAALEPILNWSAIGEGSVEYLQHVLNSGISLPTGEKLQSLVSAASGHWNSTGMMKFIFGLIPSDKLLQECASLSLHTMCVKKGNFEGLKLLFEQNIPMPTDLHGIIRAAILSRNISILKHLWERLPNKEEFDIQKSLEDIPYPTTPEITDFLVEHGAKPTSQHLQQAAANWGSLQVMAHLIRLGCRFNGLPPDGLRTLSLKYLREHMVTNAEK